MRIYQIDPITDVRWSEFVEGHPKASVFHTVGWLEALRRTYGYEPVVFTTSPPDSALKSCLLFCHIESWLTGHRLVSLPFSDHCDLLCDSADDLLAIVRHLHTEAENKKLKYLEVRPVNGNFGQTSEMCGFQRAKQYFLHVLDLSPDLDSVFHGFDKDSVQRRIHRADRAGLMERCGRSDDLLQGFYALFIITRGRHGLPPIPYAWFRNLIECQGSALDIRVAYKVETPVAAILTLRFRNVVYYKYGCSDSRFNLFGAMPWLLWKAITAAKLYGAAQFDLGRTEEDNPGLLAFKNHWVAEPKRLVYWRFPASSSVKSVSGWRLKVAKHVFSSMPDGLRTIAGNLIYRHIG
jgi:lipid II:glycine glycyltransferase (peptidoglycan interpeptide bridge formation enzyme)